VQWRKQQLLCIVGSPILRASFPMPAVRFDVASA